MRESAFLGAAAMGLLLVWRGNSIVLWHLDASAVTIWCTLASHSAPSGDGWCVGTVSGRVSINHGGFARNRETELGWCCRMAVAIYVQQENFAAEHGLANLLSGRLLSLRMRGQ